MQEVTFSSVENKDIGTGVQSFHLLQTLNYDNFASHYGRAWTCVFAIKTLALLTTLTCMVSMNFVITVIVITFVR